ncbi:MAG: metal ABC transporter solute-binding protein, Zn/Mn family, partial [Acidimicrobiales bacterium]
ATGEAKVVAVAAENEYANVVAQVGGRYVSVGSVMGNPNTDPHDFEASASVAEEVGRAQLVVQNGVGYDSFMGAVEAAVAHRGRQVVVVQGLLHVAPDAFNPHLWYDPATMPAVAGAVARDLSRLQPRHAAYFAARAKRFDAALQPWLHALAELRRSHPGTPVAVAEPVADYMLVAAGARVLTPASLQSAVMNGTDPSPQDISTEETLIARHKVKVFVYNRQVTDRITEAFLAAAKKAHVPVVAVYETMPAGYDYQSWMLAEADALQRAVVEGISTSRLR